MTENQEDQEDQENALDSWKDFLGSHFLDAEDVKGVDHWFVITDVELDTENYRPIIKVESEDIKAKFSLNVTNANFVKNKGIKNPKDLVGKKICFNKVQVFSPKKKKDVQSLRVWDIKDPENPENSENQDQESQNNQ